jgi:hypothetical protein
LICCDQDSATYLSKPENGGFLEPKLRLLEEQPIHITKSIAGACMALDRPSSLVFRDTHNAIISTPKMAPDIAGFKK